MGDRESAVMETRQQDDAADAPTEATRTSATAPAPGQALSERERAQIEETLVRCGWVIEGSAGAAASLGLHPNTLRSRLKKLGITRPR